MMSGEDFHALVQARQSDRKYDPTRSVPDDMLERILETTKLAPSACNSQPWSFVVVTDKDKIAAISRASQSRLLNLNRFMAQAPVHIIVVAERANLSASVGNVVKKMHYAHYDIGIAMAHLTLAARAEGLGSCILGWIDEQTIRSVLNIPAGKRVLFDILLGYSLEKPRSKKRKDLDKIVHFEQW